MKYEIIKANKLSGLSELINKNNSLGWICKGGVTVDGGIFYQAISHPSDGDHKPHTEEDDITDVAVCSVCGDIDCTKPLHIEISALSGIIKELLKVKA